MKLMLLLLAVTAFYVFPTLGVASPPRPPSGSRWEPLPELSDEFDGTVLNPDKWMTGHPFWSGRPPSRFDAGNVRVHDGSAWLLTTIAADKTGTISAACLASKMAIASFGYYEARMKASSLSMTSSFWLQNKTSEIDVVEAWGAPKREPKRNKQLDMHTHFFSNGPQSDVATAEEARMTSPVTNWHIYGIWWRSESSVWFYLDGVKVSEQTPRGLFNTPMWLIFDTEPSVWEGLPTEVELRNSSKNVFQIDWVRAWKEGPAIKVDR